MLLKEYRHEFGFSVSHTTRAPRKGEVDGVRCACVFAPVLLRGYLDVSHSRRCITISPTWRI